MSMEKQKYQCKLFKEKLKKENESSKDNGYINIKEKIV